MRRLFIVFGVLAMVVLVIAVCAGLLFAGRKEDQTIQKFTTALGVRAVVTNTDERPEDAAMLGATHGVGTTIDGQRYQVYEFANHGAAEDSKKERAHGYIIVHDNILVVVPDSVGTARGQRTRDLVVEVLESL